MRQCWSRGLAKLMERASSGVRWPGLPLSALLVALSVAILGCSDASSREAMAAEIQAAAPDQIVSSLYRPWNLVDDAELELFVPEGSSQEEVDALACEVVQPILRRYDESDLFVFFSEREGDAYYGAVHEICGP